MPEPPSNFSDKSDSSRKIIRFFWVSAGTFFLALGIVGILLPVLPTTPFLLLAAACYLKGSKRMYKWLLTNKLFGRYLSDYREKRGLSVRAKIVTIVFLWTAISATAFLAIDDFIIRIILFIVAIAVTLHILTIKTKKSIEIS
ncbi:MAG: YbaN family protein [Thermoplasmata archaeon]|nr:YbaN family protein [Thermoplasmata archaeon]